MSKNKKLFSINIDKKHIEFRLFGVKLSVKRANYKNDLEKITKKAIIIQDGYSLEHLKNTTKLILFLTPEKQIINGGVMSIFSLCATTRGLNQDALCLISTPPNTKYTYAFNNKFANSEQVYRFSQIIENCTQLQELILHIPDFYIKRFYSNLSKKDIQFFKSVKNLQINIMNQNIEFMPKVEKLKNLYKLTDNITQTVAHDRYATQEICNKYKIPTHLFSALWDMSAYKKRDFSQKEKIIVLSPDANKYRENIVNKMKKELPDWSFIMVKDMTFAEYMDLISRAFFTITFGEGYDGYFLQPFIVGSIGISVYNEKFFPNDKYLNLENVFISFKKMEENIVSFIKTYSSDEEKYTLLSTNNKQLQDNIYNMEKYKDNLRRFYNKQYDYLPQKENK